MKIGEYIQLFFFMISQNPLTSKAFFINYNFLFNCHYYLYKFLIIKQVFIYNLWDESLDLKLVSNLN